MNPYLIIGALATYMLSVAGAFFYGQHEANAACKAKVDAVQLQWQQSQLQIADLNAKAAAKAASDTDVVQEAHHAATQRIGADNQKVQTQIKVIHDAAPTADCLRQPVDPGVDQLLRKPASTSDRSPAGISTNGADRPAPNA